MISLRPRPCVQIAKSKPAIRWRLETGEFGTETWRPDGSGFKQAEIAIAPVEVPSFTEQEYNALLTRNGWNYDETVYLIDMCRQYNLKFLIVADRYDPKLNRTVVELKERFYEVDARLKSVRGQPVNFRYDAEWDRKRRLQLESFHSRPTAEQMEEVFIMDEIERVTRVLPRLIKEREDIMMTYHNGVDRVTLNGLQPNLIEVLHGTAPSSASAQATPRRKSVPGAPGLIKQGSASSVSGRRDRKRSVTSTATSGLASHATGSNDSIASRTPGSGPGRKPKPTVFPTHLGSSMLQPIRVGLTRHVDKMMLDYGLPLKPSFATPAVMAKYDEVRHMLARLADAKKLLESSNISHHK